MAMINADSEMVSTRRQQWNPKRNGEEYMKPEIRWQRECEEGRATKKRRRINGNEDLVIMVWFLGKRGQRAARKETPRNKSGLLNSEAKMAKKKRKRRYDDKQTLVTNWLRITDAHEPPTETWWGENSDEKMAMEKWRQKNGDQKNVEKEAARNEWRRRKGDKNWWQQYGKGATMMTKWRRVNSDEGRKLRKWQWSNCEKEKVTMNQRRTTGIHEMPAKKRRKNLGTGLRAPNI